MKIRVNKFVYFEYMAATNFTGTITHHSNDDITLDFWGKRLEQGFLSERSEAIATYALCGFSSIISAVMVLGVIYAIAPKRKKWITSITIPALVAGNLANCMTGCFA
ncbi:solute carrier family 28 member 3-like, partial [Elysia marginata]